MENIKIQGAKIHNLKNMNLTIPKRKLVVITGISGSGKSSLAFDILFEEGKNQYLRSIGVLAGLDTASEAPLPYQGGSLGGRMLVLCDLKDKLDELLPMLRQSGAGPECLKAVLTEHNRRWNVLALHKELRREQEEMRRLKR